MNKIQKIRERQRQAVEAELGRGFRGSATYEFRAYDPWMAPYLVYFSGCTESYELDGVLYII